MNGLLPHKNNDQFWTRALMTNAADRDKQEKLKLIEVVQAAIQSDNELREKYQIGDKFRFVRDRLSGLLQTLQASLPALGQGAAGKGAGELSAGEVLVYVYLYNAQGLQFRTWQNLVTPKVFYEYSVNRPIYGEASHVESLLRMKTNKAQHAYLTVAVKSECVYRSSDENALKDAAGNQVIKVKEGSLHIEKVIAFTHEDKEYRLNKEGELVKKG